MHYFWLISGIILALVWLDRLRDAFHAREIADIATPEWDPRDIALPKLSIIVPARNEGPHVEAALRSMLALDYSDFEVIAINDRSTDDTGEVIDNLSREVQSSAETSPDFRNSAVPQSNLKVLRIENLPAGWLGKPHAMYVGAQHATGDWLLFTDADVRFRRDAMRRAITYAEAVHADHLVVFPSHELHAVGERMGFAAFSMMFVFGHRPWRVHDPKAKDFLGFGPFNLIRRDVYEQIGTAEKLRMEVIEDMKLGKLVKASGFSQRVAYGPGLVPWRWFHGTFGIVRNLQKNLFAGMNYRYEKALGGSVLLAFLAVMPYVGLVFAPGWLRLPFAIAVAAILGLYVGMSRRSQISAFYFLLHPVGTLLLLYAMMVSIAHAVRHRGVVWRGTLYPISELRKGLV